MFKNRPEVDVVGGTVTSVDYDGTPIFDQLLIPEFHYPFKFIMTTNNILQHSSVMIRMERLKDKIFYNYVPAEDYDLWLRLLFKTQPEPIFYNI